MRGSSFGFFFASALTLAGMAPLGLGGCASGGLHLFSAGPGARFSGAQESRVMARIRQVCADFPVGEQRLGTLLDGDEAFRALTQDLYRGKISNDAYVGRVLSLHPAPDGNVPGTGCVINQLSNCISGDCGRVVAPVAAAPSADGEAAQPQPEDSGD